jgi:signal transduction histidine kinase
MVLIGVALPTIGGTLTIAGVLLIDQRDLVPITTTLGNILVAWGLFRYRLFDLAPIGHTMVFKSIADAVIVIDRRNRVVDLNPSAYTLICRYAPSPRIIGQSIEKLFEQWSDIIKQYSQQYDPLETELTINTHEGPIIFVLSISPIHLSSDYIGGRTILLKDMTDRKRTEAQLLERSRELEKARAHAEHADQLKSQFLASMSHELRTPLNAILNFNQFVSSGLFGPVTEKQIDALEKSTQSARHLLALINDVLDMSKIESGYFELSIENGVDLRPDIDEVMDIIRSLIAEKPIELSLDITGDLPRISLDRRRTRQIMLNLLSNAVKYTGSGQVRFRVWSQLTSLMFAVSDTGPGIPLTQQSIIFEPFRQLKRDSQKAIGTGLGLPIARMLVEAHGGTMWLESEPDQGSTFYFSLPLIP